MLPLLSLLLWWCWLLQRQPFFSCYDWSKILAREYRPEFVPPKKRRSLDVDNFDKEFTQEPAVDSVVQTHLTAQQEEIAKFEGFTYDGGRGGRMA